MWQVVSSIASRLTGSIFKHPTHYSHNGGYLETIWQVSSSACCHDFLVQGVRVSSGAQTVIIPSLFVHPKTRNVHVILRIGVFRGCWATSRLRGLLSYTTWSLSECPLAQCGACAVEMTSQIQSFLPLRCSIRKMAQWNAQDASKVFSARLGLFPRKSKELGPLQIIKPSAGSFSDHTSISRLS